MPVRVVVAVAAALAFAMTIATQGAEADSDPFVEQQVQLLAAEVQAAAAGSDADASASLSSTAEATATATAVPGVDASSAAGAAAGAESAPLTSDGSDGDSGSQPACADEAVSAESLDAAFATGASELDGFSGADYQRAIELPDGRVLWTFQDVYLVDPADPVDDPDLVHNAGLIQDGMCFEALHSGSDADPTGWVGAESTQLRDHWYWLMDGYVLDDDTVVLFVVEMSEQGDYYLGNAVPVATWTVELDLTTMQLGALEPAPDPGTALYGFSVATDDEYVYLYAQCHRQFGFSELGFDECTADVYVARQPLGQTDQPLEYWNGSDWTGNSGGAENIAPSAGPDGEVRSINPMQIERTDDGWVAVTDVDDWWGDEIYIDVADAPQGPWTTVEVIVPENGAGTDELSSYFASVIPTDGNELVVAVGTNRWDGTLSDAYRPNFNTVTLTA